jgi:hypothetical protein
MAAVAACAPNNRTLDLAPDAMRAAINEHGEWRIAR